MTTPAWQQPLLIVPPEPTPAPKKGIKTSSAKAKGRKLQQAVASAILASFPELEPDDVRSTSMGAGGEDVQLSPAARKAFPFTVECKQKAEHSVYTFYDQASHHGAQDRAKGKPGYEPLVVVRADGRKALAVVDLDFFMAMASVVNNARKLN